VVGGIHGWGPAWVRRNRLVRPLALGLYRILARTLLVGRGPRILANSIPKAGTHLLSALLMQFPDLIFSGRHHVLRDFGAQGPIHSNALPEVDWSRCQEMLDRVRAGQFLTAHLPYHPAARRIMEELGYRQILIIRDPRDIVVSLAHYITHSPRHFLHVRFREEFHSDDQRLMACIVGIPLDLHGAGLPDVGTQLRQWLPWRQDRSTYVSRYEHLVGMRGGGSAENQIAEILEIGRHLERFFSRGEARVMGERVWSSRSPTFRRGTIGDWRTFFNADHVDAMREIAGTEMGQLGYLDW
jgi:hypothetical protein